MLENTKIQLMMSKQINFNLFLIHARQWEDSDLKAVNTFSEVFVFSQMFSIANRANNENNLV